MGPFSAACRKRVIFFHGKRHPAEMGEAEVTRFLSSLAVDGNVAGSTQNQALSALLFLYKAVPGQPLPWLDDLVHARRPKRLPVVLTRDEVQAVLQRLTGTPQLMATLLYGSGLRVLECARLRVKDLDFAAHQIVVRDGGWGAVRSPADHPPLSQAPPSPGGPTAAPSRGYAAKPRKIIPPGATRLGPIPPVSDARLGPAVAPPTEAG